MALKRRPGRARHSGFTLIEISIAILTLAVALITLLGLQSASLERALRDKDKQQAMLLARSILAYIESRQEPLDIQDRTDSVKQILETLMENQPASRELDQAMETFQANLKVEYWPIPGTSENSIKRITTRIFWSEDVLDSLEIVYFIPNEDSQGL